MAEIFKSKTLRRLGLIENWSWPLLWFTLPFYAAFTILYDAVYTGKFSYLWYATFAAATIIEVLFVILCKKIFLENLLRRHPYGLIGAGFAAITNIVRNLTVALLAIQLGLIGEPNLVTRIVGAGFMGIALYVFYVTVMGSKIEHNAVMQRLQQAQNLLLEQRRDATTLLRAENQRLLDFAQGLLVPRLNQLQDLLADKTTKTEVVRQIQEIVAKQVRPLSAELSSAATTLTQKPAPTKIPRIGTSFLKEHVQISGAIRPNSVLFLSGFGQIFMVNTIFGADTAMVTILGVLAGWLILTLIKLLIPKHLRFGRLATVSILIAIGALSGIPVAVLNWGLIQNLSDLALFSMIFISPILAVVGFAISAHLDELREAAEKRLATDNAQLVRETSLFHQKMWIAKRSWSFVVHGTVQSALTAALTRLNATQDLEQYQVNLVLQDLDRAKAALMQEPHQDVNFTDAMQNIARTWQGICNVTWEVSERANRALLRDSNLRMCLNEICKEVVSNAVRHGAANLVQIQIERAGDEIISIQAHNNGLGVLQGKASGLGSKMFDELTIDWQLTSKRALGQTTFTAELPTVLVSEATIR